MLSKEKVPFILGSIFLDPVGIGVTLATFDVTDLFGVLGDPPGTLGEASYAKKKDERKKSQSLKWSIFYRIKSCMKWSTCFAVLFFFLKQRSIPHSWNDTEFSWSTWFLPHLYDIIRNINFSSTKATSEAYSLPTSTRSIKIHVLFSSASDHNENCTDEITEELFQLLADTMHAIDTVEMTKGNPV